MGAFLNSLPVIIITALILAAVCTLWAYLSAKNEKNRNLEDEKWECGDNGCFTAEKAKDE